MGRPPLSAAGRRRLAWTALLVLAASVALGALMPSCSSVARGVVDGRLADCPSSPNCVCSEDRDASHAIEPLAVPAADGPPMARLLEVLADWPRVTVVQTTDTYVHATFTTRWLRFTDDVEFRLDASGALIHVRSASRIGYSDLGTNRALVEALRTALAQRSGG